MTSAPVTSSSGGGVGDRLRGRTAARWWHGVVAAMSLTGVVWELFATFGRGPADGDSITTTVVHFFSYFTILSNILVGVTCVLLLVDPLRDGRLFRVARLDALLCIAVTGIVYNTVLAGLQELSVAGLVTNLFMHQAGPLLAVVGWLVVGPRPRIDTATIWWSVAAPLAWIVYIFVQGAFSRWYPYPFMDATEIGYPQALLNTGVVAVVFLLLAAGLGWVDRHLRPAPSPEAVGR
ncbi:Pr6Pr family membrane protein [Oerskovia sp. NPDC057915]|uniref:Pr6Pr family membrane protein n=1 Tax=Oerskovia sp. NPDC057915 TaxID=3346280 RepID=UPI0036DC19A9